VQDRVAEFVDELASIRTRIRELENRVDEVEQRTQLLHVSDTLTNDATARRVAILQHLETKARRTDGENRAAVDTGEARTALNHPNVDRTTITNDLREAPKLVGDTDVCWYDDGQLHVDLTCSGLGVDG
jgi:hypothetical protein